MNKDHVIANAKRFADGRAGAKVLCGSPEDCFKEGWFPTVSGARVNCGDKHPTPDGGFSTKAEAIACAQTYKQLCRDWLAQNQ